MSIPVLPALLKPLIQGYGIGAAGGVRATDVAGGAPRQALEWDRGYQEFRVSMNMRPERFQIWNIFYLRIIKKGALTFEMQIDSGMGLEPHDCTMVPGSYGAVRINGQITQVSFVVRAESKVYDLSDAEAGALMDLFGEYGDSMDNLLDRLAIFANKDTLVWDF